MFCHLDENLWPWTTGSPFVDVPLFWLLPQTAQAILIISTATHHLPANRSARTIASFIGTFVTKFMALVDLCLASIARATVRSVGILRTLAEELTLPTEVSSSSEINQQQFPYFAYTILA